MAKKHKKKLQQKEQNYTVSEGNAFFYYCALIAFGVLLFYPPFFRGLFFKTEQQWTLIFAAVIFFVCCLWQVSKHEYSFLSGPQSYAAFGMLVVYIIAFHGAADTYLAVAEIIKMGIYFFVFWIAGRLVQEKGNEVIFLRILYLGGVCVALAGFLSAVGVLDIKDGFVGNRIYSTLQYPNSLAIYLAAILFFGLFLWLSSSGWQRLFYAAGNFILFFVFVSTNSRGGFLVFLGMAVLFLLGVPRARIIPSLYHLLVCCSLGIFCSGRIIPAAVAKEFSQAWIWFFLCVAGSLFLSWFWNKAEAHFSLRVRSFSKKQVFAGVLVCLLVFFGVVFLWGNSFDTQAASGGEPQQAWYFKLLPDHIAKRISTINLESAQDRLYWTLEAFDLVKENPLFGLGGGAWEAAYRQYQDYPYSSTQVHNHFLQIWAEVGTVGFLVFVFVWVSFVLASWKNLRSAKDSAEKLFDWVIFVSAFGLGVHSFIDFDLALGAVSILLWTCFGISWGRNLLVDNKAASQSNIEIVKRKKQGFIFGTSLLALLFVVLPASLLVSNAHVNKALAYAQANNLEAAEKSFVNASRMNPFYGEIDATLASVKKIQNDKEQAIKYMEEAIKKSPYDYSLYSSLSEIYLTFGDIDAAIEAGKESTRCAPWLVSAYDSLTNAYVQGGIECLENGRIAEAKKYFTECSQLPETLEKKAELVPEKAKQIWTDRTAFFNLNPRIKMNIGISQLYLCQFSEAQVNLNKAYKNEKIKPLASFWLAVLSHKSGSEEKAEAYLLEADKKAAEKYNVIKGLPIISK